MNRIFPVLSAAALVMLGATMLLGFCIGDMRGDVDDPATEAALRMKNAHFLSGIAAALAVVLVDSILVTYFIGTGRWCREVTAAYRLDAAYLQRSARLKRRTFPLALLSVLVAVGMTSLGAAADPAVNLRTPAPLGLSWAEAHLLGAGLGTAFLLLSFFAKIANVESHRRVIADILEEVRRIRAEKGLDA